MEEYFKIDKALREYECHNDRPYMTITWICDRIDWAWQWKKISRDQMEELSERIIEVMKYA